MFTKHNQRISFQINEVSFKSETYKFQKILSKQKYPFSNNCKIIADGGPPQEEGVASLNVGATAPPSENLSPGPLAHPLMWGVVTSAVRGGDLLVQTGKTTGKYP